jgi:hypothetical protein
MMCGAVLVRPDAAHEVDARGVTVLIAFVDPESKLGAALSERIKPNKRNKEKRETGEAEETFCVSRQVRLRVGVFQWEAKADRVRGSSRGGQEMNYCTAGVRRKSILE